MDARMLPAARAAVDALVAAPDTVVALVSGRSLNDLRDHRRARDDSPVLLAGSHGAEFWVPGEGARRARRRPGRRRAARRSCARTPRRRRGDLDGVWIEPKTFGFGVHTRERRRRDAADAANRRVDAIVAGRGARTGVAGPATTSSSTRSGTRARTPRSRSCASAPAPRPCCSPATTSPTRTRCASLGPDDLGVHVGDRPDRGDRVRARHPRTGGAADAAGGRAGCRAGIGPLGECRRAGIDVQSEDRSEQIDIKPRSRVVTDGIEATTSRGMLRAVGMGDEDWDKPQIGIASSWNEITPCNLSLDRLAQGAKEGVHAGGGYPLQFGTISVSDGISMGHEGMHFSLVSREVIADSVETVVMAERLDGTVLLAGCDKSIPGMLMASAPASTCRASSSTPARSRRAG